MSTLLKRPSAWIPIALSLIALAGIFAAIAIGGAPASPPKDEGAAAHLFQIWLVVEMLMIGFFAAKHLPQAPKPALLVLMIQIFAVLAACAPVFYLNL